MAGPICPCAGCTNESPNKKSTRNLKPKKSKYRQTSRSTTSSSSYKPKPKRSRVEDQLPICVVRSAVMPSSALSSPTEKSIVAAAAVEVKKIQKHTVKHLLHFGRKKLKKNSCMKFALLKKINKSPTSSKPNGSLKKGLACSSFSTKTQKCCCLSSKKRREPIFSKTGKKNGTIDSGAWKSRLRPRPLKSLKFRSFKEIYKNASNSTTMLATSSMLRSQPHKRMMTHRKRSDNLNESSSISIYQMDISPVIDLLISPSQPATTTEEITSTVVLGGGGGTNRVVVNGDYPDNMGDLATTAASVDALAVLPDV